MPTFLSEILTQLRNIWAQLSGGQRLITAAVLSGVLLGMIGLVYFATRPDYRAIGNDLDGEEKRMAVAAFEEARIDFRIENSVLMVNGSQYGEAEKALTTKGLRGTDSSTREDSTSSFTQDRDHRSYTLQLSKIRRVEAQIRKMDDVRSVLVNVYEPNGPNILRKQEPRRASVMLDLARGSLFPDVAKAVRGIVASSLGISPEEVQVTDSDHQVLSGSSGSGGTGFSPLIDLQNQTSAMLTMRARMMLEQIWPGKTLVSVNATYDNKVVESNKKIVSTDKVVLKEKSYKTKDSTGSTASGDPNGVGSTTNSSAAGNGAEKNSSITQTDRDYQPIIGEESLRVLAPDIEQLSVSLMIDESLSGMKAEIEKQVKNAIGWKQGRDSEVAATSTKFEDFTDLPEQSSTVALIKEWAPLAGQILSVLFVVFFLKGLLKRNKATGAGAAGATRTAAAGGGAGRSGTGGTVDGGAPGEGEDSVKQTMKLRKEIEKVVADDPASVSRMLESWLSNKEPA
ncbi:MAG: hypothetical protein H6832_18905 [Planctomycetes bacterium]|nr:hypothetical protein [Planctomycetota bacterium]MCB9920480.1 hypothetical protein [Planctomycetota bacterium]